MKKRADRIDILGTHITPMRMEQAVALASSRIETGRPDFINFCTVNNLVLGARNQVLRRAVNRGIAVSDGMPLVWLCRLAGFRRTERIYGPDFMTAFCRRSVARGYRHFFYGGGPGIAQALALTLEARFPGLAVAGTHTPGRLLPGETERPEVIDRINAARPDIVWVGLGAPKQDLWVANHRHLLSAPVLAAVGAAFDFHTGRIPQAPVWMRQRGLEWLFRLSAEPRRLAVRYLVNNPLFILLLLMQGAKRLGSGPRDNIR